MQLGFQKKSNQSGFSDTLISDAQSMSAKPQSFETCKDADKGFILKPGFTKFVPKLLKPYKSLA